jgi:hypothetical protein
MLVANSGTVTSCADDGHTLYINGVKMAAATSYVTLKLNYADSAFVLAVVIRNYADFSGLGYILY